MPEKTLKENRKVYVKSRGAFGRSYRALYDLETGKKLVELRKTKGLNALLDEARNQGWEVVDMPRKGQKENPPIREEAVELRRGLEALYSYDDWQKIDNAKIKKQEHRAIRILKAFDEYEEKITALEARVEELEIELAGKQGRYEGLTERFLNLYLQLKDGLNYSGTFRDRWIKQLEPYFEEAPMANELVKEIEEAEGVLNGELAETYVDGTAQIVLHCVEAERIQSTLQRAREALTWIPVEERLPAHSGAVLVQNNGCIFIGYYSRNLRGEFVWFDFYTNEAIPAVEAWMEKPAPYTPEEK